MRKNKTKFTRKKNYTSEIIIGLCLILFFFSSFWLIPKSYSLVTPIYQNQADSLAARAEVGLQEELKRNETTITSISRENDLTKIIDSKDPYALITFINTQLKQNSINVFQIVNAEGTILARAANLARRGDNIFLSTPWGQIVNQGKSISIYATNIYHSTRVLTGIPIYNNSAMVGAIFGGHELDDEFAHIFRSRYLPADAEVVFYNDQVGIIGDSFVDANVKKIIKQNFRDKSLATIDQNNSKEFHIKIADKYYLAKVLSLPDARYNQAKIIIFTPHYHGTEISLITALLTVILFIGLLAIHRRYKIFGKYFQSAVVVICVAFYASSVVIILHQVSNRHTELGLAPYPLYNSTLFLRPASGFFDQKFPQEVSIAISSGGESINAIEADLRFDPTILQVRDIDVSNSICHADMFLDKYIDNQAGEIHLSCIIPSPGFDQENGIIANLKILPLKSGDTNIIFSNDSRVLANDGLATNVLRNFTNGNFQISELTPQDITPIIFSFSHPNNEQWYTGKTVDLSWNNPNHDDLLFSFDQNPNLDLSSARHTTSTATTIQIPKGGIFYAHLKRPSSTPSVKKIMIDDVPPEQLVIKVNSASVKRGESIPLLVEAHDAMSGLEKNFYLKSETGLFLPAKNPTYLSYPRAGRYPITVRVYDLAGNHTEDTIYVTVK